MSTDNTQAAPNPVTDQPLRQFFSRMLRAARLDPTLYEEVENDRNAMGQAVSVIILASIAAGLGSLTFDALNILIVTIGSIAGWFLWAFITFFIGTRFLPTPQTHTGYTQLLRTIGFASSPGLIRIFGIIPALRSFILFAAAAWMIVAMIIAVKEALDYNSVWRAAAVVAIGWTIQFILMMFIMGIISRFF
ncbi:MAG: YIP1 family protein [Chitinispirillales bacterium]|jgi:hypothetical protein|nr:YIP1 family protein [Chitinispirillales bacterium]